MSKTRKDLIEAIQDINIDEVLQCLNDGVDVNECDSKGFSPLMKAIQACMYTSDEQRQTLFEIVELLILRGAEINKQNVRGRSSLHFAICCDFLDPIKILIANKADVNIQNNDKETPLGIAVEREFIEGVKLLLENKADPTLVDTKPKEESKGCGLGGFFSSNGENPEISQLLEEAKRTQSVSSLNKM